MYEQQKELRQGWAQRWASGAVPDHVLALLPRALQGRLVPAMGPAHGLQHLHLAILGADLADQAARLDAIRLAVTWARDGGAPDAATAGLVRWLRDGLTRADLNNWRLTRAAGVPEAMHLLFQEPGGRLHNRRRDFRGMLPED